MTDPEIHAVDIVRSPRDYRELTRLLYQSQNVQGYSLAAWMIAAILVGTAHEWLSDQTWVQKHIFYEYGAFYMAAMIGIFFVMIQFIYRIISRNVRYVLPGKSFLRPQRFEVDAMGLKDTSAVSEASISWKGVTDILRTRDYLLFYVDAMSAHIIPVRSFPSKEAADAFYKQARAWWTAAKDNAKAA